jgi:signal transduction histidine kinase
VSDSGVTSRLTFVNRLLGHADGWSNPRALLGDFCTAFGARAAGLRWPAEGPAVLLAETTPAPHAAFQAPVPLPPMSPGLFWADGVAADDEFLTLTANALGCSPAVRKFLGPVVEQGRVAQRLEDAAKVAGRVAHDLDNVFQGVTGFNALAMELLPLESHAHQNIREADGAARHGMKFCAQLHQLSRGGHARPLPAGVATTLAREVGRLVAAFPVVRFEVEASPDLPPVAVEGSGLQLLLGNLLDNAAEATPKDAAVRVSARLVELAPGDLPGFLGCPATGPHVEVRIANDGAGLTDDAKRRMFVEPFFTTKFRHRGLGLAVVYRMLYAHRGGVQVDSQPGQGTTLRVVLPLAAARVPAVEPGRSTGGSVS